MFSRAVKIFTLQGFEVKVDPSWLLIAALITWSLGSHAFPQFLPGLTPIEYFSMAVFAMLGFFGSLLLHEMSHSVVARRYGVGIKGITLFVFGGVAELEDEPKTAGAEFWIALAGPAMSFALSVGFWLTAGIGRAIGVPDSITTILSYLASINLILGLFNLVPAFPLDGGRVLRAYLWDRHGDILKATETAAKSGAVFAYTLMILGLLALFGGQQVSGLWQILIGGFLLMAARSSYQQQLLKSTFGGETVASLMSTDVRTAEPSLMLSQLVDQTLLPARVSFVPVVDDEVLLGYVDTEIIAGIDQENWSNTSVGDVFITLDAANCVTPETPAIDLLTRITETGRRKFLVARDGRLLGVVTLSDLTGFLGVIQSLRLGQPQR